MPATRRKRKGPAVLFGEKGWRFVRLWQTLMIVVEAERPLSVTEINKRLALDSNLREFEGKIATTRDDLWVLVRCGFPILVTNEAGEEVDLAEHLGAASRRGKLKNTRWSLRSGHDIGRLAAPRHCRPTSSELTTLSLLRALLQDNVPRPYPLFDQLRTLLDQLQSWLMGHGVAADRSQMIQRFVMSAKRSKRLVLNAGVLSTVTEALHRDQMIEGDYRKGDEREVKVQVLPLAAWIREGRAHLFAARGYDGALRTYRLDRFATMSLQSSAPRPQVDRKAVERLLAGRFGGFVAEPERVKLRAAPEVSYLFNEYEFHPSQQIRRRKDGSLLVTLECAVSFELEEWLLGFAEHVEVLAPAKLRERVAKRLKAACALYQKEEK